MRRTVAIILLPMPVFMLWAATLPVSTLVALLSGLLGVACTAAAGLLAACPDQELLVASLPEDDVLIAEPDTSSVASPVEVPGVDLAELAARVEALEGHALWVVRGLDEAAQHAQAPPDPLAGLFDGLTGETGR